MIQRKNVISIEYELNDLEMQIVKSLSHCPLTVENLHVILKFHGMGQTSMAITRRLNDLCIMGLVIKKRKNKRVYIYSLAK